jgi:hypothetical protein
MKPSGVSTIITIGGCDDGVLTLELEVSPAASAPAAAPGCCCCPLDGFVVVVVAAAAVVSADTTLTDDEIVTNNNNNNIIIDDRIDINNDFVTFMVGWLGLKDGLLLWLVWFLSFLFRSSYSLKMNENEMN